MSNRDVLKRGNLTPQVHERLSDLIVNAPFDQRRVAVFDFDNTVIYGDIGELYSHFLIDEMMYRYDLDAFWELIAPEDGRDHIRELTETALSIPEEERSRSDVYHRYLADMGAVYGRKLQREGKASCYEWAVRLHVGISELDMKVMSQQALARELRRQPHVEERTTSRDETVSIRRGIRFHTDVVRVMDALRSAGFEVWIVSATNYWSVASAAHRLGIAPTRVIGNRVDVEYGVLTDETVPPALFRGGKVDVIEREIGCQPMIVFGDSDTDYDMLCHASELGVVIDTGNELLRSEAEERGWLMQPQKELTTSRTPGR